MAYWDSNPGRSSPKFSRLQRYCCEVEDIVELYISPSGPSWPLLGSSLPLPLPLCSSAPSLMSWISFC